MKKGRTARSLILTLVIALLPPVTFAAEPPPGLLKKIAATEEQTAHARDNYTYRQSVTIQELDEHNTVTGQYREVRDVTFSPTRGRYEQIVEQPKNTLTRIRLTPEDFADIRNVDPLLLTTDNLWLYEGKYKGEENIDGFPCFVEYVQPKQIFKGGRYFQGYIWARKSDLAVIRTEGEPVPQIETLKEQNLFPHFTTIRKQIDGQWWFPIESYADDTLYFRERPQRVRIVIKYENYKHFGADTTITYGNQDPPKK